MAPLQIEMLLHFYGRRDAFPNMDAPAQSDFINGFLIEGLITEVDVSPFFALTPRGEAYVRFICSMPLPVANWTIPGPWTPSYPRQNPALERMARLDDVLGEQP